MYMYTVGERHCCVEIRPATAETAQISAEEELRTPSHKVIYHTSTHTHAHTVYHSTKRLCVYLSSSLHSHHSTSLISPALTPPQDKPPSLPTHTQHNTKTDILSLAPHTQVLQESVAGIGEPQITDIVQQELLGGGRPTGTLSHSTQP